MSSIQRLCGQCGEANPLDARYCGHCGYDTQNTRSADQANLPAVIGRAALPVLVGAAGLAVRAGWRLLQSQWARDMAKQALQAAQTQAQARMQPQAQSQAQAQKRPPAPKPEQPPAKQSIAPVTPAQPAAPRSKRTVHIRSAWRVSDGRGGYQQGTTEHHIEINE